MLAEPGAASVPLASSWLKLDTRPGGDPAAPTASELERISAPK
jgi:hypothetical protein